jgi:hypothetical protein
LSEIGLPRGVLAVVGACLALQEEFALRRKLEDGDDESLEAALARATRRRMLFEAAANAESYANSAGAMPPRLTQIGPRLVVDERRREVRFEEHAILTAPPPRLAGRLKKPVHLQPLAFEVLVELATSPGLVVTEQDLLERLDRRSVLSADGPQTKVVLFGIREAFSYALSDTECDGFEMLLFPTVRLPRQKGPALKLNLEQQDVLLLRRSPDVDLV